MENFVRNDKELLSEPATSSPADSTEKPNEPTLQRNQLIVTPPPPIEMRSTNTLRSSVTGAAAVRAPEEERAALFASNESADLRARWDSIQVGFVDEPRRAVEEADELVSTTMKRLAEIFADERQKLEQQWDRNTDISTEDFRVALRRYRSFFGRLLAI
jgi:hypothetical protein